MDACMTLRILTPEGAAAERGCDSVVFLLPDGADGRGGGFAGIMRNHAPAVMALAEGPLRASLDGKPVLEAVVSGGFASVRDNVVTVLTESVIFSHNGAESG